MAPALMPMGFLKPQPLSPELRRKSWALRSVIKVRVAPCSRVQLQSRRAAAQAQGLSVCCTGSSRAARAQGQQEQAQGRAHKA